MIFDEKFYLNLHQLLKLVFTSFFLRHADNCLTNANKCVIILGRNRGVYMNQDLKLIKKKYGEAMMHLCRELFSTILDNSEGLLPEILFETFHPNHFLYDDLVTNDAISRFKEYIYTIYEEQTKNQTESVSESHVVNPVTLMRKAGYTLYECLTEEDIQSFRKYYTFDEALCTFRGGRLNNCYVYFAVKDGAEQLKRSQFHTPNRQDKYGTSILSIQFTRDYSHTLSIKNRYNHTVPNPDATFSNDLDNIIPGLTESFSKYYGMTQQHSNNKFELPYYVRANDGKFYRYNYEINNIYYCSDNIVINQFRVTKLPKEKYLVLDYFILDLVNKQFINPPLYESFHNTIGQIKNISILNNQDKKLVTITPIIGEDIIIELDKYHRIISYQNNNVTTIGIDFLSKNLVLKKITLNNVTVIGNRFLFNNRYLLELSLPKVEYIGNSFLYFNTLITKLELPNVTEIESSFMEASTVTEISMPKLLKIGSDFMTFNKSITEINLPKVIEINANFLGCNQGLKRISLPNVQEIGPHFLEKNIALTTISLPNVEDIGPYFCSDNKIITKVSMPKVRSIGHCFMFDNKNLSSIELPEVLFIGTQFLYCNTNLTKANMPNLRSLGEDALKINSNIRDFYAPELSSKLENHHLRKLVRKSKPKLLKRILNINKRK